MKRLFVVPVLVLLACVSFNAARAVSLAQDNANMSAGKTPAKKRPPIFRATKEQIKQAQTTLKQRGFYNGESTGKLDADTRAGLKKYQESEGLKVTGTLNRVTLVKMNITLTDKQKAMTTS